MTKDFLWRLKLHVGNWNEWPQAPDLVSYLEGEVDLWRKLKVYLLV